jgi:hypothetical protein
MVEFRLTLTVKRVESRNNPKMTHAMVPVIADRNEANALALTEK